MADSSVAAVAVEEEYFSDQDPIIRIWSRQPHPPTQLPLLLFDLNGVLVRHTRRRVGCHEFSARPGVEHLVRLLPHFELGVYTSATERTVRQCLAQLHREIQREWVKRRTEPDGAAWPDSVPARLFSPILVRSHCSAPTPEAIAARGGNPWDTLKPLARYFSALDRVVLLDDSAHKILPAETRNHLLVPAWVSGEREGGEGEKSSVENADSAADPDAVLPTLVDGLIRAAASPSLLDALPGVQARLEAALTGAATANEIPRSPC
ncbi:hypothetical protein H632_c1173p0 [Helicosporidium sp. ATCC 50920]|nr:hypothetical protein H632_c1173p0 [Helicosporidium sp. ATCC 50920]|eukprot:KDD74627.1 hypothetical protein H632_c1173p0 [Helicosporidium sp. ATCC 50920]